MVDGKICSIFSRVQNKTASIGGEICNTLNSLISIPQPYLPIKYFFDEEVGPGLGDGYCKFDPSISCFLRIGAVDGRILTISLGVQNKNASIPQAMNKINRQLFRSKIQTF